jgi:FtsZ-binding cell division protein ZapB
MALIRSERLMSNLRRRFGVAAPKLSVKTHWSWKVKATISAVLLSLFGWLYYSGFDAGRLFAGFNVGKVEEERSQMVAEIATLRSENERLKKERIDLANSSQMAQGAKDVLSKQLKDLQEENTRLKEETSFFEKLLGKNVAGKNGLAIQRLQAERETADAYRFRALVVQGTAENQFKGRMQITAQLVGSNDKRITINLPEEQAELQPILALDFKAYQRVEGVFKVPANAQLKTLSVRVTPAGSKEAKAQQSLQL